MHDIKPEGKNCNGQALAIASVACQKWSEVYEPEQALAVGTVFPELNKPFYAASTLMDQTGIAASKKSGGHSSGKGTEKELLREIDEISFTVYDLSLYLDTHETDAEALALFGKALKKRKELMKEFALKCYPLTQNCMADEGNEMTSFRWADGPAPWDVEISEGVC